MQKRFALLIAAALIFMNIPCHAKGQHIICAMSLYINHGTSTEESKKSLKFYMDDSGEKLIAEGGDLSVETTLYSDTKVEADASDIIMWASGAFLFGEVKAEPAVLLIDRTSGIITIAARTLPQGALLGSGNCKLTASPPTKF